jgi:hypothetical protein
MRPVTVGGDGLAMTLSDFEVESIREKLWYSSLWLDAANQGTTICTKSARVDLV